MLYGSENFETLLLLQFKSFYTQTLATDSFLIVVPIKCFFFFFWNFEIWELKKLLKFIFYIVLNGDFKNLNFLQNCLS